MHSVWPVLGSRRLTDPCYIYVSHLRYFTPWKRSTLEDHILPKILRTASGQEKVPFGVGAVATTDVSKSLTAAFLLVVMMLIFFTCIQTIIASETCEELWTPRSPHVEQFLGGR